MNDEIETVEIEEETPIEEYVPYEDWEDRIVENPNHYRDQNGNLLILEQEPGEIYSEGTPVEAERMLHIERGIKGVSDRVKRLEEKSENFLEFEVIEEWDEAQMLNEINEDEE